MRCKIVRFQKLMWRNMMRSTKSQKVSILHYSIDYKKERRHVYHYWDQNGERERDSPFYYLELFI